MNKLMKRTAGFSLLELMVVVAIIGVLASFAVPRYNIFRARARQGEAKSNMGVIFTLQEAFKIDRETYYNGVGGGTGGWGGDNMNAGQSGDDNYVGYKNGGNKICKANKLGFRLANCGAARYRYWIASASENDFLAYAYAPSDASSRIFPGCSSQANPETVTKPSLSTSQKKCANSSGAAYTAPGLGMSNFKGGDAFCMDQGRVVDNFKDIVSDTDCTK